MDARTRRLLEAPVGRTLVTLALPNVLVMVAQASIGLIETYFAAKLGVEALAGMALVFPLLMLLQMVSAGAMGGGILSAVARALGGGRTEQANELVWSAVVITALLATLVTFLALRYGPWLYATMGGRDGSLAAASAYSAVVFAGSVPLWLFNSLAAVIRGTGNMRFPATVTTIGALVLIPLSPVLIFGLGPVPALGIVGGAVAVVLYYVIGCAIFVGYVWSGRGPLKPSLLPPRLSWSSIWDILRIGAASSLVSLSTNISIATATGLAGVIGPSAVAGYGTGVRLEYLLVPLVFGLGAPMAAMVGTSIGAGNRERAMQVTWTGAAIAAIITESIGLVAALNPAAWLGLFGSDPRMIEVGSRYLQIVGPCFGFFGGGLALYFTAQGAGRIGWAVAIAFVRVLIAAAGGWLAVRAGGGSTALFLTIGSALVVYGVGNVAAVASGVWFRTPRAKPASTMLRA